MTEAPTQVQEQFLKGNTEQSKRSQRKDAKGNKEFDQ